MLPRLILLIIAILIFNPVQAHGGGCACTAFRSTGVGGPIITIPAYTMPKGLFSVGYGMNFLNSGRLNSSQIGRVLASDQHADDNYGSLNQSLSLAYGLTDDLNLAINLPFNISWDYREVHDGVEELGDSIGFGDITLMSQYRFLNLQKTNMALLAGIKLPTGKTHVEADNGEKFEAINNPGTGSFDPLFGFAISRPLGKLALDFNFLYKLATDGSQNTNAGDSANYNFSISYAINHDHDEEQFSHQHFHDSKNKKLIDRIFPEHLLGQHLTYDLILETTVNWEEKPTVDGARDANHGGTAVFLNPGIRITLNDHYVYTFGMGFPIIEDLNGEQGGTDLQIYSGLAIAI